MKTKFEPCKLMELAIKEIGESFYKPRIDRNARTSITTFAHCVVQKLLEPDNGTRQKGIA